MKKLLIAGVTLISVWGAVNAQEFKAGKGNVTADLSLFSKGIFATESPVMLNSGMLKGRYFISDGIALRGALSLMTDSQKDTSNEDVTKKQNKSQIGMRFGVEKHFSGTDRLSPYIGGDIGLAYQTQSILRRRLLFCEECLSGCRSRFGFWYRFGRLGKTDHRKYFYDRHESRKLKYCFSRSECRI